MNLSMAQRALAKRLAPTQPTTFTERWGTVVSVSSGKATIRLAGDSTDLPSVPILAGVSVTAGATVIVRIKGTDCYVAGRLT